MLGSSLGRGLLVADLNRDGHLDVVIVEWTNVSHVYLNDGGQISGHYHHLRILAQQPCEADATRLCDALDARVSVFDAHGRLLGHSQSGSVTHFLGQSENVVHFGLGNATVAAVVRVHWPRYNYTGVYTNVSADQLLRVRAYDRPGVVRTVSGRLQIRAIAVWPPYVELVPDGADGLYRLRLDPAAADRLAAAPSGALRATLHYEAWIAPEPSTIHRGAVELVLVRGTGGLGPTPMLPPPPPWTVPDLPAPSTPALWPVLPPLASTTAATRTSAWADVSSTHVGGTASSAWHAASSPPATATATATADSGGLMDTSASGFVSTIVISGIAAALGALVLGFGLYLVIRRRLRAPAKRTFRPLQEEIEMSTGDAAVGHEAPSVSLDDADAGPDEDA